MVPKKINKFKTKVYLLSETLVMDFSGFLKLPSRLQQTRGYTLDIPEKRHGG